MIRVITKPSAASEQELTVAVTPSPRAVFSLLRIFEACGVDAVGRDERPYGKSDSYPNW
jgi:hypothetical protein